MFGQASAQTPESLRLDPPDTFRSFDGPLQIGHRLMQVEEDLGRVLDLRRHYREATRHRTESNPKRAGERMMSGSGSITRSMMSME